MVHLRCALGDTGPAVEAPAALNVHQHRPNQNQVVPFAAEQELIQVSGFTEHVEVLPTHERKPCTTNEIRSQGVKFAKAVCDAAPKLHLGGVAGILMRKSSLC